MMQNEETIAATTTTKITLSKTKSLRFPQKLYNMLEQAEENKYEHQICWALDGKSFRINEVDDDNGDNEAAIVSVLRAGGFKHTRYKSFLRQLMLYNFERTYKGPKKGECKHAYFVRGRPELFQQKSVKDFQQYQATKMMLKNNAAASTPTSSISTSAFVSPPNSPIRPTTRCLLLSPELVFSLPPCPSLLNHSNNDADDIGNIKESGCPYMKTSIIPTRLNNCNNDNSDKLLIPYKNMGDCSALFDEEQEYGSDINDIIFIDGENSNNDIIPLTETEIDMLWEGI